MLWRLLLATVLLTLCTTPQAAPKRVALLIGNSQYQFESSLPNPVRDVRLLAQTLRGLGFSAEVLENLPKREMDLAIKRFVRDSAGADTALLYYAGHGQQPSKGGRSFLLPVNANAVDDDQLEADGVPAEDIAAQLERLPNPARLRLVVLDACRNTRAVSRSTVRGLAPPARTDSFTLIAYSTDANAVAQDGAGQNSPYAQALTKHLPGLAGKPVRQVFEDTAREVRHATRQQQSPRTYGDLESRIGLDGVELAGGLPEAKPPAVNPDQDKWTAALRDNTEAAYADYLRDYPNGAYAGAARNALAALRPVEPRPRVSGVSRPNGVIADGRYELGGDGSEVKDLHTGLSWARCSVGQRWDGKTCAGDAKRFTFDEAQATAGQGWRVPTVRELARLIHCSTGQTKDTDVLKDGGGPITSNCIGDNVLPTIRGEIFPNTPSSAYWSSSLSSGSSDSAWVVPFDRGSIDVIGRHYAYGRVRLVRASQ